MLNAASPPSLHFLQNVALILITLIFLPLSTIILFFNYVGQLLFSSTDEARRRIRRHPSFRPKTILVTGVNMNKGLALARDFYEAGHDVIGADFEHYDIPIPGRFSRSLRKFEKLPKPAEIDKGAAYFDTLVRIIHREHVDLWVNCAGLFTAMEEAQAKEIIERRTRCVAIQFDVATTSILHQKHIFLQKTQEMGLPVPETHHVTSKKDVLEFLHGPAASDGVDSKNKVLEFVQAAAKSGSSGSKSTTAPGIKYIMKAVGIEDAFRSDMTLLPLPTISETDKQISPFPISSSTPWVLQEFIHGDEYCTHALIVNNVVKTFVACPSSNLVMRYKALPSDSSLSVAMRRFTEEFVARSKAGMTGHLSFDFMIKEAASETGVHLGLRVIECNPRAHTAAVLFAGRSQELTEAYLSALPPQIDGDEQYDSNSTPRHSLSNGSNSNSEPTIITPREDQPVVYWIGHEIVTLLFLPFVQRGGFSPSKYLINIATLVQRVLFWTDGMFALWDPLPFWWLYHVYWPGILIACAVTGRKYSRLNVSTGRILEC